MSYLRVGDGIQPLDSAGGGGLTLRYRISHKENVAYLTNDMVKRGFGVFAVKIVILLRNIRLE